MNNKTEEFLQKLAPCIERGELEACVEEAARVAREMGIGAEELWGLYAKKEMDPKLEYVILLASAQGLVGKDKVDAYFFAAQLAGDLEWKDKEEENYKKALEVDPRYEIVHNNYASLLIELGRKEEAEQHYLKAIEADPKEAYLHYNYAILLKKLGRVKEAEEHYEKAIELDKKFVEAYINYANLLRDNARFSEAEKGVRAALQYKPENPYAHRTLGDILADENYFQDAEKEYQAALKNPILMEPSKISEIHNNLGWVYAQLKQYSKAETEFKKAVELDEMNIRAIRNIRKLGKIEVIPEVSRIQIGLGILLLLPLIESYYLFWINKLSEAMFVAQSTILIALLIFIILYHQLAKVKIGSIEFEKSTEHRFIGAKNQPEFER
jgi:Tfp pilus assembly protein PilF